MKKLKVKKSFGSLMKKITGAGLAVMILGSCALPAFAETQVNPKQPKFSDVPNDLFAKESIERAVNARAMVGTPDGKFQPNKNLTRAEAVQILFNLCSRIEAKAPSAYTDVKRGSWYCAALDAVTEKGLVKGYADGSFKPDKKVTYEEFAAMIANYIMWANKGYFENTDMFKENQPICKKYNPWAKNAMILANDMAIHDAKIEAWLKEMDATQNITRGDAAIFAANADRGYKNMDQL